MEKTIPTYNINTLSGQNETSPDVFFIDQQFSFENSPLDVPYRSNYFGVGICLRGKARLKANLETYNVEQNSIVAMSPQIVKQWVSRSDDYQMIAVFFTKEFLIQNIGNTNFLDHFPFLKLMPLMFQNSKNHNLKSF
jgi:AraC family transcriptional activator of pobA